MGFSTPKAVKPLPAPPPISINGPEAAKAAETERRKQENRQGYDSTLDPEFPKGTTLSGANTLVPRAGRSSRKTLLTSH